MSLRTRVPIWLIPNLLSLDAPLVAVAWLYIFASTWRVYYHPWPPYAALALSAWCIYVLDRLFDSFLHRGGEGLRLRHRVHKRLRRVLLALVPVALGGVVWLSMTRLPVAIFSYAAPGVVLVAGYFASSLLAAQSDDIPYLKNLVAGIAFSYGTAVGAHVYTSYGMAGGGGGYFFSAGVFDLLKSREMLIFGVLCALNITAVNVWERGRSLAEPEAKAADEMMLTLPLAMLAGFALLFAMQADPVSPLRPFYYAILVSAALLMAVNRIKQRFSTDALRVIADLCLLAPWLYFVLRDR